MKADFQFPSHSIMALINSWELSKPVLAPCPMLYDRQKERVTEYNEYVVSIRKIMGYP